MFSNRPFLPAIYIWAWARHTRHTPPNYAHRAAYPQPGRLPPHLPAANAQAWLAGAIQRVARPPSPLRPWGEGSPVAPRVRVATRGAATDAQSSIPPCDCVGFSPAHPAHPA